MTLGRQRVFRTSPIWLSKMEATGIEPVTSCLQTRELLGSHRRIA
jgi:hypothetical protein